MKIEIDQSGKVEQTAVKTVIADSLNNIIVLRSGTKKRIQALYRQADRPRMYVFECFSALVALLIYKSYKEEHVYVVDTEYLHQDDLLRSLILRYLRALRIYTEKDHIRFSQIGKKSTAHDAAYKVYKEEQKVSYLRFEEVLRLLFH